MLLIASAPLLAYSLALLPAYLLNRHLEKPLLAASVAVLGVFALALLPHYLTEYWLRGLRASDFSYPPTSFRPRSFELPYQAEDISWTRGRAQGLTWPVPPCAELCQQLLLKGDVGQIFVYGDWSQDKHTRGSTVFVDGKAYLVPPGKRTFRPIDVSHDSSVQELSIEQAEHPILKWRRFRLQQQDNCPATLTIIRYPLDGRCLIEETVDRTDADAVVSVSKAVPERQRNRSTDPCQSLPYLGIQHGPTTITISERRDGKLSPVEARTALVARYAAIPFHFSVRKFGDAGECLGIVTDIFPRSYADPFEMISRRYGLPIVRQSGLKRPPSFD
jgi:hypothetical protein